MKRAKAKLRLYAIKYSWDCPNCGLFSVIDLTGPKDKIEIVQCSRCGRKRGVHILDKWYKPGGSVRLLNKYKAWLKRRAKRKG